MQQEPKDDHVEILSFEDNESIRLLMGNQNANLKLISDRIGISIGSRGGEITLRGSVDEVKLAINTLNELYKIAESGYPLGPLDVNRAMEMLSDHSEARVSEIFSDRIMITGSGNKSIVPKSVAQKHYVDALRKKDLVLSIGPAGTGKTYLAMAVAVTFLLQKKVKRIILTRPAVEAGERLGFLPGDLKEKVNPYLRPLYDALYDMVDIERAKQWMQQEIVEVAPLAFMRGRTLNDSFIILDEAQNTSPEQMKMFLTRLGYGSKAAVTGDITQIDLPNETTSGLIHASRLLSGIEAISICRFTDTDVVRHPLVQQIVRAYEKEQGEK